MANLQFSDLYNAASRWANDTTSTGVSRAKDAVAEANKQLSYGTMLPPLKPWWRLREGTLTPVAGTQGYVWPTDQGTLVEFRSVWYRIRGDRFDIDLVDDERWNDEANENTAVTGTPEIANVYSDGIFKIRFSPIPSSSFISAIDGGVIRYDGYLQETLETTSGDSAEPLMPNSRRFGIVWKAVEFLGALQGDQTLIQWAASQGTRYYQMIVNDDITRTGAKTRQSRPMQPVGLRTLGSGARTDYGHVRA